MTALFGKNVHLLLLVTLFAGSMARVIREAEEEEESYSSIEIEEEEEGGQSEEEEEGGQSEEEEEGGQSEEEEEGGHFEEDSSEVEAYRKRREVSSEEIETAGEEED